MECFLLVPMYTHSLNTPPTEQGTPWSSVGEYRHINDSRVAVLLVLLDYLKSFGLEDDLILE